MAELLLLASRCYNVAVAEIQTTKRAFVWLRCASVLFGVMHQRPGKACSFQQRTGNSVAL
jgi:hypothetical protein